MSEEYIRPAQAEKMLKVCNRTLQLWEKAGRIKCYRTKGGHRRFLKSDIVSLSGCSEGRSICYARVSTASQKEDLERQVEYFRLKYPDYEVIKDIGSGLNFKRKGFNSILDSAYKGDVKEVVVTHKDRLCRFGFELVQKTIEFKGGKIVVLNEEVTSPEEELTKDLISIITVFSSRLYGLRSHKIKGDLKHQCKDDEIPVISHS